MSDRVSSYGQSNYILSQALRLQAKYDAATNESASGLKSQDFSGIAPQAQQVLNLESQYSTLTAQTTNAQTAQNKINAISNALSGAGNLIASALSNLSSAISSSTLGGDSATTQEQLQADLSDLASTLNTQYAGNYLFGGSVTNTPPVNLSASGYTGLSASTANTAYYQGNDGAQSVQVTDDLTVSYGVTADNSAFEQAFRALSLAVANPGDTATLQQAYNLLSQASSGVSTLQAEAGAKSSILDSQITVNTSTLTYLDNNISDLTSADLSGVSVQLSDMGNQLQASYSALANILKLNLASYLR